MDVFKIKPKGGSVNLDAFKSLLKGLMQNNPVFYSEAHLQYGIAREIAERLAERKQKWKVYLEKKIPKGNGASMNIDIVVELDGVSKFAVEVKYKFDFDEWSASDAQRQNDWLIEFPRKAGGGENRGRYGFWEDVHRLETFMERNANSAMSPTSYALFLTNNTKFLKKPGEEAVDRDYSIDESKKIEAGRRLKWFSSNKKQVEEHPSLSFRKSYDLTGAWQSWGDLGFKYLLVAVGK